MRAMPEPATAPMTLPVATTRNTRFACVTVKRSDMITQNSTAASVPKTPVQM